MGAISSSLSGTVTVLRPTILTLYNLSAPVAGTEYSQVLANGTKQFTIVNRGRSKIQWTTVSGESGTNYASIKPGATYSSPDVNLTSVTIYLQTNVNTQTIEIMEWT